MVALNGTRNYINDFSNISIITRNISTIFHYIDHYPQYINDLTKDINLPTNHDNISAPLPTFIMVALNGTRNYINDFSNISIITRNISTIFSLYRSLPAIYQRFDKGYQFADKSRQYQRPSPLLLSIYYNLIYVKI